MTYLEQLLFQTPDNNSYLKLFIKQSIFTNKN
jgi:hypothetical protein